jgi:septal ring factor EnvC (AmiA/AmiB activator)
MLVDYLVAGLAFVVAMAALFLASDASRKAQRQVQDFLTTYLNPIKESNSKNVATVQDLSKKITTLEKELEAIRATQTETEDRMTRQDKVVREMHENMTKFIRSISAQQK